MICFWQDSELNEFEDQKLIIDALKYKGDILEEFKLLKAVIEKYPQLIDPKKYTLQLFTKAYTFTISRCFGWTLPTTMLIPFADNFNHSNKNTVYHMFNPSYHYNFDKSKINYYKPNKMRTNYTLHSDKITCSNSKYITRKIKFKDYSFIFPINESMIDLDELDKDIWN